MLSEWFECCSRNLYFVIAESIIIVILQVGRSIVRHKGFTVRVTVDTNVLDLAAKMEGRDLPRQLLSVFDPELCSIRCLGPPTGRCVGALLFGFLLRSSSNKCPYLSLSAGGRGMEVAIRSLTQLLAKTSCSS